MGFPNVLLRGKDSAGNCHDVLTDSLGQLLLSPGNEDVATVTTYYVITAFTGAAVNDTITCTQILSAGASPAVVGTLWQNLTQGTILGSAPSAANLNLLGEGYLTNAQLRATALPVIDAYQAPATVTWTSATTLNTVIAQGTAGYDGTGVTLIGSGTLSGGVITFEIYDGSSWLPAKINRLNSYNGDTTFALTGITGGATQAWQADVAPFSQFRVRLSTVITGAGSVLVTLVSSSAPIVGPVTVGCDPSQPLPAGTNVLGGVTTQTSSTLVTPTISTSAYTAGYVLGGVLSFANAFGALLSGVLQSLHVAAKSVQTTGIKAYVFNANPGSSTFTDHAAPSINSADIGKLVGVYTLGAADSGLGTHTVWALDGIGKAIVSTSTTLYVVLIAVATPTFASTSDISVTAAILKDG